MFVCYTHTHAYTPTPTHTRVFLTPETCRLSLAHVPTGRATERDKGPLSRSVALSPICIHSFSHTFTLSLGCTCTHAHPHTDARGVCLACSLSALEQADSMMSTDDKRMREAELKTRYTSNVTSLPNLLRKTTIELTFENYFQSERPA